jgi:hypothetical protein
MVIFPEGKTKKGGWNRLQELHGSKSIKQKVPKNSFE